MKLKKTNVRKLLNFIRGREDNIVNMCGFLYQSNSLPFGLETAPKVLKDANVCGTVGCIAGWASVLRFAEEHPLTPLRKMESHSSFGDYTPYAAEWLGLSEEDGRNLFHGSKWSTFAPRRHVHLVKINKIHIIRQLEYMLEHGTI